jgi:muramidase (phage lysozyme)
MSGSRGAFTVGINAVDNASKVIDGVSRSFQRLTAPVEKFNKSVSKLGDVTGVNRLTEGLRGLGAGAADAFRSMDRLAGPMGAITGAASIAGMVELTRRWGQFGQQLGNVAGMSNAPVGQLSNLSNAFRVAGTSAQVAVQSVQGFQQTLQDVAYGRNPEATSLFSMLGISAGTPGHVKKSIDALKELAEAIKDLPPQTQIRDIVAAGLPAESWVALHDGAKGLQDLVERAERTGAEMTPLMVEHATKMNKAWTELGEAIEGVGNRIVDNWSGTVTKVLEWSAKLIEDHKHAADVVSQTALGAGAVGTAVAIGGKVAGASLAAAGTAGVVGAGVAAITAGGAYAQNKIDEENRKQGLYFDPSSGAVYQDPNFHGPAATSGPQAGPGFGAGFGGWMDRNVWAHKPPWQQQGQAGGAAGVPSDITPEERGLLATIRRTESGGRYGAIYGDAPGVESMADRSGHPHIYRTITSGPNAGQKSSATGAYQFNVPTWDEEQKRFGRHLSMSNEDQDIAATDLMERRYAAARPGHDLRADLKDPKNYAEAAAALHDTWTSLPGGIEQGATGTRFASDMATNVGREQGRVAVDIHLHGAPPGTTATASSSGPVRVPPPRIETAMAGVY